MQYMQGVQTTRRIQQQGFLYVDERAQVQGLHEKGDGGQWWLANRSAKCSDHARPCTPTIYTIHGHQRFILLQPWAFVPHGINNPSFSRF